ncbi:MAG: hypothetical protein GF317_24230 [Candidatus Lokiarchaeota archaeon]|nr:hypothetical protein [Candidatus Lokiarchaeota archaeon]MBD3202482.1 hypothetical protein [Candidatus Lokiarchaeota archaeon]
MNLTQFFRELFKILKEQNVEIIEPWIKIFEIPFLTKFNEYDLDYFIDSFDFIKKEKWNHISVNKIQFIFESMKYIHPDIKNLSKLLDFRCFEKLVKSILQLNGYNALNNFYFSDKSELKRKTNQKRYEIDVIGVKNRHLLLIDAKQWKKREPYQALNNAANTQLQRTIALNNNRNILSSIIFDLTNGKVNLKKMLPLNLIPLMVTLEENRLRINDNQIPLVSIYKFNSFLQELELNLQNFNIIKINNLSIQKTLS